MSFAEYRDSLRAARDEEYSEPEDWPEYGRKVPLRYPSGRPLIEPAALGLMSKLGNVRVQIGENTSAKSGPLMSYFRWTEVATSIVKEELDDHEQLHIPSEKISLLVQTIAQILSGTDGSIDKQIVRNIVALAGEVQKTL